jgi:general secretion pathway protein A
VPRKLNMLLTRVLLMGAVERRERIDGALVDTVLADIQGDAPVADRATNPPETPRPVDAAVVADIPETPIEPETPTEPNEPVQDEALDSITAFDGPKNAPVRFFRPDKPPPVYDAPEADGAADMPDDPMIEAAPEEPVAAIAHDLGDFSQEDAEETTADEADMAEYDEPAMPAMEATAEDSTPGHDGSHDPLGASAARIDELVERIDLLSGRVADQEETIRRLVTILLEYVERDEKPAHLRAA